MNGYNGRIAIHETLPINEEILDTFAKKNNLQTLFQTDAHIDRQSNKNPTMNRLNYIVHAHQTLVLRNESYQYPDEMVLIEIDNDNIFLLIRVFYF